MEQPSTARAPLGADASEAIEPPKRSQPHGLQFLPCHYTDGRSLKMMVVR